MSQILSIFDEETYNQYLLIGIAVLILISIKIWSANKAYQRKLTSFIHPDTVIGDLKQKFKSVEDAQNLLAFNILKVKQDPNRLRNIAFLMAYLKQFKIPLKPLQKKINETFENLPKQKLSKADKTYKQYILNEIEEDGKDKSKEKKKEDAFYTI